MIALGAKVINNSHMSSEQTSGMIIAHFPRKSTRGSQAIK